MGEGLTVTTTWSALAGQFDLPTETEYVVVVVGDAMGPELDVLFSPAEGDQANVLPPDTPSCTDSPAHKLAVVGVTVGRGLEAMVTSSTLKQAALVDTVQRNVADPARPETVPCGSFTFEKLSPEPLTTDHLPVPVEGVTACSGVEVSPLHSC